MSWNYWKSWVLRFIDNIWLYGWMTVCPRSGLWVHHRELIRWSECWKWAGKIGSSILFDIFSWRVGKCIKLVSKLWSSSLRTFLCPLGRIRLLILYRCYSQMISLIKLICDPFWLNSGILFHGKHINTLRHHSKPLSLFECLVLSLILLINLLQMLLELPLY